MTPSDVPILRLLRARSTWAGLLAFVALAAAFGWAQRRQGAPHGADHALDAFGSLLVPLLTFGLVSVVLDGQGLVRAGRPLVRLGADGFRVALLSTLVAMAAAAVAVGVLGAFVAALAHGKADPPVLEDARATLAFGALGGAAYAAYFMLGSALLPRFWGRGIFLALDWLVGGGVGLGALFTPRANLHNLLGGEAPFEASSEESLAMLAAIAVGSALLAAWRAGRARV